MDGDPPYGRTSWSILPVDVDLPQDYEEISVSERPIMEVSSEYTRVLSPAVGERKRRTVTEGQEILSGENVDGFIPVSPRKKDKMRKVDQISGQEQNEISLPNLEVEDDAIKCIVSIVSREILPKQFGLAKLLRAENIKNILKIMYKSPYRALIELESRVDCDSLINCEKLTALGFKCQMLDEMDMSFGLVRQVDLDIEEKEVLENLKCDYDIISVRRLKRLAEDGKWVDSETIRLSIKGSTLPPYVYGYGCRFKVDPYTFPVSQCSGCWKFGHLARACPAKRSTCPKCSGEHKECETTKFRCANCSGSHMAVFRECPVFLKEKEIRRIMSAENCTYRKALNTYLGRNMRKKYDLNQRATEETEVTHDLTSPRSYRNVLMTQAIVHREEIEPVENTQDSDTNNKKKEEKLGSEVEYKKTGKKKRNKKSKPSTQDRYEKYDSSEIEMQVSDEEEKEEDTRNKKSSDKNDSGRKFSLERVIKVLQHIILSAGSLEDKLKRVFKFMFDEIVQYLLSLFKTEKLLSTLITFGSDDG